MIIFICYEINDILVYFLVALEFELKASYLLYLLSLSHIPIPFCFDYF
jgi:hypothetical protein